MGKNLLSRAGMGWAFGLVWDRRQGGGRRTGRTDGRRRVGKTGEGGRGVHSEGVYRGYIWPLVLVNGGREGVSYVWPLFAARFLCVNLILFAVVGCFFFSFSSAPFFSSFSVLLSCFLSHLFNLVCSRLWSLFLFLFLFVGGGGKKFCGKGLAGWRAGWRE